MLLSNIKRFPSALLGAIFAAIVLAGCAHTEDIIILDSDVSFAFGSAELTDAGKQQLDMYSSTLATRGEVHLDIVGHTDRIGSKEANMALSKRRADAVRDRLLATGRLEAKQIRTRGVGSSSPVVYCDQTNQQELIACLAPNRRVVINVTDTRW